MAKPPSFEATNNAKPKHNLQQLSATVLSADAETFVPGRLKNSRVASGDPAGFTPDSNTLVPHVPSEPNYERPINPAKISACSVPGVRGYRMKRPTQGYAGPPLGSRGPPHHGPGIGMPTPGIPHSHGGIPPSHGMHFMPPDMNQPYMPYMANGPVMPHQAQGGMPYFTYNQNPQMAWPPGCRGADYNHNRYGPPYAPPPTYGHGPATGGDAWWEKDRKKGFHSKGEKDNMVSVGIQNDVGALRGMAPHYPHNNQTPSWKRGRTRTIILMDAANQTDFFEDIANLTLAEYPNSLYNGNRSRSRRGISRNQYTSSDSEESDSGYSSPLHRRNQTSTQTLPHSAAATTHAAGGAVLVGPHLAGGTVVGGPHIAGMPHLQNNPTVSLGMHSTASVTTHMPNAPLGVTTSHTSMPLQPTQLHPHTNISPLVPQGQGGHPHATNINPVIPGLGGAVGVAYNPGYPGPQQGAPPRTVHMTCDSDRYSSVQTKTEDEDPGSTNTKNKKRRKNKRRRKKSAGETASAAGSLSAGGSSTALNYDLSQGYQTPSSGSTLSMGYELEGELHFEDEEEFPQLNAGSSSGQTQVATPAPMSYSQIVQSTSHQSHSQEGGVELPKADTGSVTSAQSALTSHGSKETKNAKKRRKRRELANKAAEEELAEISLEQQVLMTQVKQQQEQKQKQQQATAQQEPKKKTAVKAGEKTKAPVSLNIAAMLDAFEKQQEQKSVEAEPLKHKKDVKQSVGLNPLDSSAPVKRGKERETPKPKKPSPLKKVILKEREERKRSRLLDGTGILSPPPEHSEGAVAESSSLIGVPCIASVESDLSQDADSKTSQDPSTENPESAELSPISQTSPISMSPLTPGGSPLSSGVNSPIAANAILKETRTASLAMKIHSRRFREYCNQMLEKEIDNCCTLLLQDLVRFQDRLYHKDPVKAKSKRRIVLGLREVTKHLKLHKMKCVVISPNLERIQSKGGLDEALNNIIQMCQEQDVPFVFALGRRALGRACAKLVPVSVVGIFNYEGSEAHFKSLMDLTSQAREAYRDMVTILEKDMAENPSLRGDHIRLFAHMGHSRTPSACSAISFTSSILSEPISENYPQSEPETDSRGYEITRNSVTAIVSKGTVVSVTSGVNPPNGITHGFIGAPEADEENQLEEEHQITEERSDSPISSSGGKHVLMESLDDIDEGHEADTEDLNDYHQDALHMPHETRLEWNKTPDSGRELHHIDSIHSSVVDLNAEILSQHSSQHTDATYPAAGSDGARSRKEDKGSLNKDRTESWVVQHQMEGLSISDRSGSGPEEQEEEEAEEQ